MTQYTEAPAGSRRTDRGTALVELVWLGILLLIPMLWIVMSVFEVQRGAFAVSAGARAAGRAYALAPNDGVGRLRAEAAAKVALEDQGVGEAPLHLAVTCRPGGDCHQGRSVITVVLRSRVDLPLLPIALGGRAPSFALSASHTLPIGQFQEIHATR